MGAIRVTNGFPCRRSRELRSLSTASCVSQSRVDRFSVAEAHREREKEMSRRRLLVLLKPGNVNRPSSSDGVSRVRNPQILGYLENRSKVHMDAVKFCQDVLRRKAVDWEPILRSDLVQPIRNVDLVVTIGGDGTLLQASHFMDDTIPVLGVNSDPTQVNEVKEFSHEFDASRSTGYLCAATVENFEQVLDDILEGHRVPSKLTRISIRVNNQLLSTYALNDVLIAHPSPAAVSWFSFRIKGDDDQLCYPFVNCRSSGLRLCTATGSTAAMLSAGGSAMPISSQELQFMVREPISPGAAMPKMRGFIKPDQSMDTNWYSKEGMIYVDGSHLSHSIQHGDIVEISSKAPTLDVFLPSHRMSKY